MLIAAVMYVYPSRLFASIVRDIEKDLIEINFGISPNQHIR